MTKPVQLSSNNISKQVTIALSKLTACLELIIVFYSLSESFCLHTDTCRGRALKHQIFKTSELDER